MTVHKKDSTLKHAVNKNSDSMLMAYFNLNAIDPEARNITYFHLPEFYTYNHKEHKWHKRRQRNAISRIYTHKHDRYSGMMQNGYAA
ncbi:hypothetical protein BGZ90_012509 [Linnemannia elongata]|nr:hypothetical protein BGZ90_012509 [Linnemannia elongata]